MPGSERGRLRLRGRRVDAEDEAAQSGEPPVLASVGEVIFRAFRHKTALKPDRQEARGLQFTTDFRLRARTPSVAVTSITEGREPNA